MLRKDKIKVLDKKVAEINKELKALKTEDKSYCYDCSKDNCMHNTYDEEKFICHNFGCRHNSGFKRPEFADCSDHYLRCKKCLGENMNILQMKSKVKKCCGFTPKNMPCKCNKRCC